ncbi:MAG: [NiFe]-hydrogenase assembly chaperone HybE [Sideroxydans sp.]|nr:[NiFe]-hydrogenase assembly chaperone HybE [Sideroxydans sp.]
MDAVVEKLEAVFNDIAQTRMAGLPICNPALRVQVVGLREWQGRKVGVLVTPWTIGMVLLEGENALLKAMQPEEKMVWEFPSGKYEFMGLNEAALGTCQICSLISPVTNIASQEDAVNVAKQVMAALFVLKPTEPKQNIEHEAMLKNAQPMLQSAVKKPLSRRDFLRGAFLEK